MYFLELYINVYKNVQNNLMKVMNSYVKLSLSQRFLCISELFSYTKTKSVHIEIV